MYYKAQIWYALCIVVASLTLSHTSQENYTTSENVRCLPECICPSPKQIFCNTGGLEGIPSLLLPITVEELTLTKNNFPSINGDAFAILKNLKKLVLDNNNISSIKPFAFRGLNKLNELSIQHTSLPCIEQYSFATLQNVSVLLLTFNKIRYIEGFSFAGMSYVKYIMLSNNPLLRINSNAFSGLSNVDSLILPSGIRRIEQDAFANLQNVGLLKLMFMDLTMLQPFTFRGLNQVRDLNIQESDLGVICKNAFDGMTRIEHLNILKNKVDFIEQLHLISDNHVRTVRFHGNHILEAPRRAKDLTLQVVSVSAIENHFPCDCQAHNILESDLARANTTEFQSHNYCISPIEYNGKSMIFVDFEVVARCHDNVVQDNLGSGQSNFKLNYLKFFLLVYFVISIPFSI